VDLEAGVEVGGGEEGDRISIIDIDEINEIDFCKIKNCYL